FGLPPSVGVRLTGPVVARYRARYPQVGLAIVEELSGEVQQGLLTGTLDLGLLYAGTVSPSLRSEPLLAERLHVLAPPGGAILSGRPVPFHDLAGMPLLLPGRRHGLRAVVEQAAFRHGLRLSVDIEADSLRVLSELARRGLAPVIHAPSAFDAELAAGELVAAPIEPEIQRSIVLAWPRDRAQSRAALAMASVIREEAARLWPG
ncbi:MAG: LysR family transcriptional regulator, partial [Alphaproteobacteria bacterium]|nr:LysR family transcriptional regulator [Alphaproteobacteria bacterium]